MFETYFRRRKLRKECKDILHHVRHVYRMRRDLLDAGRGKHVEDAIKRLARLSHSLRTADADTVRQACDEARARAGEITPRRSMSGWRENFEVILVALGVAMAFRAYFFQPFKIPTGSMQPTLYGIHSIERDAPGLWDHYPLKFGKWILTGRWYKEVTVKAAGELMAAPDDFGGRKPGYELFVAAGHRYHIPSDAVNYRKVMAEYRRGGRVEKGDVLWSGILLSGDHLFVNRMSWNFRKPRRGEIVVFETRGMPMLDVDYPNGTHYIKRMVGLPGETISIDPPHVLADGEIVTGNGGIMDLIARRARLADWAPAYGGYRLIESRISRRDFNLARRFGIPLLMHSDSSVSLNASQYYALGDNTRNSRDCRYFGPIPESNLVGPGAVVYWPLLSPRFGPIR